MTGQNRSGKPCFNFGRCRVRPRLLAASAAVESRENSMAAVAASRGWEGMCPLARSCRNSEGASAPPPLPSSPAPWTGGSRHGVPSRGTRRGVVQGRASKRAGRGAGAGHSASLRGQGTERGRGGTGAQRRGLCDGAALGLCSASARSPTAPPQGSSGGTPPNRRRASCPAIPTGGISSGSERPAAAASGAPLPNKASAVGGARCRARKRRTTSKTSAASC